MKRKVRVKGPGVKLNNIWCYINEVAVIDEAQYEENKEYVEVIEEIEENSNTKLKEENKSVDGSDINVGAMKQKKKLVKNSPRKSQKIILARILKKIQEKMEKIMKAKTKN